MYSQNKPESTEKINILCQGGEFVSARLAREAESLEEKGFHTIWFLEDKKNRSRNDIYPAIIIKPKRFPFVFFQLISLLTKRKIKVVETYIMGNPKRTLLASLAAKLLRKPNVVMLFGSETYFYKQRGLKSRMFTRLTLRLADFAIYHHPILLQKLKEYKLFNPEKTAYVHHGVKLKDLNDYKREDKIVLYMNRFIWWKQPKLLIEAIPHVLNKVPKAKFIFVGIGDYPQEEMETAALVKKLKLESSVRFVPYTKNVSPFLTRASVFVNTSKIPFLNNSMLEAMERGIPPIALQLDDTEPIIQDRVNGILCKENPQAIAEAIVELLSNEKLRQKLGKKARETITKRYTIEDVANNYGKVFEQLMGKING